MPARAARLALLIAAALTASQPFATTLAGAAGGEDTRPYDEKLLRLSEILGAIHYLREVCQANEGQRWRDQMGKLIEFEGTSAIRKARLVSSFNKGYRSYRRTYQTCTKSAETAVARFLIEGAQISEELVRPRTGAPKPEPAPEPAPPATE